jgi:WD40 repeat protein
VVAPDESYAVFSSSRPPTAADGGDLFIVRRARDGRWAAPVHLGAEVNSPGSDAEARLSPDGRTLYFSSNRVVPVSFPRSHTDAVRDLERLRWDNTLYNIWQVDLSPWLDARR